MGRRILQSGFALAVANFIIFVILATYLGGDAFNGHVKDGQYFLGMHGRYTQVSRDIFLYSRWHVISLFFTQPVGLLCAWVLWGQKRR
jgi:hypothetical protein